MSVKTYANLIQKIGGYDCDLIEACLKNDYDAVRKIFDNPNKEEINRVANYDFATGNFSHNKLIPGIFKFWGKPYNFLDIVYSIHTPQVGGGTLEDYRLAGRSAKEFKKSIGLEVTPKSEEFGLEEEIKTKTR